VVDYLAPPSFGRLEVILVGNSAFVTAEINAFTRSTGSFTGRSIRTGGMRPGGLGNDEVRICGDNGSPDTLLRWRDERRDGTGCSAAISPTSRRRKHR